MVEASEEKNSKPTSEIERSRMSSVTNIILTCSIVDDHVLDSDKLEKLGLFRVDNLASGAVGKGKVIEAPIYIGAFNYLDEVEFFELVGPLNWESPEDVRVFIQR
jgi:hypothetical protein